MHLPLFQDYVKIEILNIKLLQVRFQINMPDQRRTYYFKIQVRYMECTIKVVHVNHYSSIEVDISYLDFITGAKILLRTCENPAET